MVDVTQKKTASSVQVAGYGSLLFCVVCVVYFVVAINTHHVTYGLTRVTSFADLQPITPHKIVAKESKSVTCNVIGQNKICQYGSVKAGQRYAIFGSTLFVEPKSVNYVFDLPLSALAWKRIGFDSIVYVLGNYEKCAGASRLRYTVDMLMELDYVVLLVLEGYQINQSVTLGQNVRLFASSMIQNHGNPTDWAETYIITADADIWPIKKGFFDLPPGKDVLHGDMSGIAGDVTKRTNAPLSFVGMRVRTWEEVMSESGRLKIPKNTGEIIRYLADEYGLATCEGVQHGGRGWFIDQAIISKRIQEWKTTQSRGFDRIYIYNRTWDSSRIRRNKWRPKTMSASIVDSHILQWAYEPRAWTLMLELIQQLYPNYATVAWCDHYAVTFRQLNNTC